MKKLHSKNIVQFIDVVETENNYYIVQEFCDGGDLRTKLNKEKNFSEKVATEYLLQLLNGFIELLTHGIIHRDMKPENILIHNKTVKIADFGFAKNVLWRSQLVKTQVGTPLYMSVEMLSEQKYTSKCDIWAIGLLFYEMLYGRVPWSAKGEFELVQNILKNPLKFPKDPEVSENAKNFIQGCLKVSEGERFGWNEVYNHALLGGSFKDFISKHDRVERKAKEVMNQVRLAVHTQDVDVEKLFDSMKLTPTTQLKKGELFQVVKAMDKTITEDEFQALFDKLDSGGHGAVEFDKFKTYMADNGIRLKSTRKKEPVLHQVKSESEDKVCSIIAKIKAKTELHKLNLETVFSSYTKNKESDLSYEMFSRLVLKIDSTLNEAEVRNCFDVFDINHDKKITFAEFSKTINGYKK